MTSREGTELVHDYADFRFFRPAKALNARPRPNFFTFRRIAPGSRVKLGVSVRTALRSGILAMMFPYPRRRRVVPR